MGGISSAHHGRRSRITEVGGVGTAGHSPLSSSVFWGVLGLIYKHCSWTCLTQVPALSLSTNPGKTQSPLLTVTEGGHSWATTECRQYLGTVSITNTGTKMVLKAVGLFKGGDRFQFHFTQMNYQTSQI